MSLYDTAVCIIREFWLGRKTIKGLMCDMAAGAALWAVDLERDEQTRQTHPQFHQGLDGREEQGELDSESSDAVWHRGQSGL